MSTTFPSLGRVVWFSSKVTDGAPLRDVCDLAAACSLIGGAQLLRPGTEGHCVEDATGHRFDYDCRSFDEIGAEHLRPIVDLVRGLARSGPVTLLPFFAYRATTRIALTTPNVTLLGNPPELEAMFNSKPWVLDQFHRIGVPAPRWHHFTRDAPPPDLPYPVVVSPPSGTGGQGMFLVHSRAELARLLADPQTPAFLSAAAYLESPLSLNVTGCVHADGGVSTHPLSLQVIGAPACTTRRFGYCGNDFGRAAEVVDPPLAARVESILGTVGRWMHGYGFRGAFGLDLMIHRGEVLVSELNPRFQGSSHLGATLMREAGAEDVYVQHIRAHLGLPTPPGPSLADVTRRQGPLSQVFCYNGPPLPVPGDGDAEDAADGDADDVLEFIPRPGVSLDAHSLLFRYVTRRPVLDAGGRNLLPHVRERVLRVRGNIGAEVCA
ncbi:MAG TPA: ATP-grasp domain-containing protein [Longimicrobium sp.]|nr:ATP-grasp domain-containing protein [Longimicrobium sp.]